MCSWKYIGRRGSFRLSGGGRRSAVVLITTEMCTIVVAMVRDRFVIMRYATIITCVTSASCIDELT